MLLQPTPTSKTTFLLGDTGSAYQAGRAHVSQDLCTCDSPTSLICPAAQVTDPAVWAAQAQQQACSPEQERPLMSFQLGLHLAELLLKGFPQLIDLQMACRRLSEYTCTGHAAFCMHLSVCCLASSACTRQGGRHCYGASLCCRRLPQG